MGSNPVVGTNNHKPTVNSAVHPSEVGKRVLRSSSEGTSTGHTLIRANLELKFSIQYKDSILLSLSLMLQKSRSYVSKIGTAQCK